MATTLIRKIPEHILPVIDDKARKNKQSREDYLRDLLIRHVESDFLVEQANDYGELLKSSLIIIEQNTVALQKFNVINSEVDE